MADATLSPDAIDLSALAFWEQPATERERAFAVLRAERPVSRQRPAEDVLGVSEEGEREGYWAVVRYDDVRTVSRDPATFCSGQGVLFGDIPQELLEASQSFLAMDAPRHTKLRGLVSAAFTPRQVARIEDRIRANARAIVRDAAPTGGGDFVELVAKRLPLATFAELLGVSDEDRDPVVDAADTMVSVADAEFVAGRDPLQLLGESLFFLHTKTAELVAAREAEPTDDLMSALVHAEVDGERLTQPEISAFFVLLSVAANDTTRHTTSHGWHALHRHPEQRAWLTEDLEGRMPQAVEELVRWATPVMTFRRTATCDTELSGQAIAEGDKVVMIYSSANRDETVFDRPGELDLSRDPNRHAGFGGGGPHYCLGASLARTQLRAIFEELLPAVREVEVGEPEQLVGGFINGVKRLPSSWTPA